MNIQNFPSYTSSRSRMSKYNLSTSVFKNKHCDDNKMLSTKDTERIPIEQSSSLGVQQFKIQLKDELEKYKQQKATQFAQIAISGDISIKNIMKKFHDKLEKEILQLVQNTIQKSPIYQQQSATKKTRSPKQLGSTIQHTFTPRTISTPGFDFETQNSKQINQFSVYENEFTLGIQKQGVQNIQKDIKQKVSEFNINVRNPTSKRIKDKIMNSKKN